LPWDPTLLQPEGGLPSGGRAQFAGCLVQHFGADYGPGGVGLLLQPLLGEAIQLVLRPHSVLVLRTGDTLNLIAERYGTTVATLRQINPQLESTQTITTVEGDSLAVLAGRHGTTESKLRSLNPVLQQTQPYFTGEGETLSSIASAQQISLSLLLPVYRSTTPIPAGMQLLVPGFMPSTLLPAGEWINLPARRSAPVLDELPEQTG